MKILCVDISPLAGHLEALGHTVLNVQPWHMPQGPSASIGPGAGMGAGMGAGPGAGMGAGPATGMPTGPATGMGKSPNALSSASPSAYPGAYPGSTPGAPPGATPGSYRAASPNTYPNTYPGLNPLPSPAPPLFNVPQFLHEQNFKPDFIIQAEHLGERTLLEGLEDLACPKIFWAIDSHLNMHWQQYYARLFNAVLTPHLTLWQALPPDLQHPLRNTVIRQMAKQGQNIAWKPHSERKHNLSFVGVLNHHRPLRTWLCELIASRWEMETRQGMPFGEMLALYANTRLVPNEAIAFETNYRLLEGASCGAVVLSPNIGPDQNNLLEPDREILVYHNGAELVEQIDMLLARPELAEKIGRAAWQRVQKEHLPIHRAEFILNTAKALLAEKQPEELSGASLVTAPQKAPQKTAQILGANFVSDANAQLSSKMLASKHSKLADLPNLPDLPDLPDLLQSKAKPCEEQAIFCQTAFWLSRVQTKRAGTAGQVAAPLPQAPPPHIPQTPETSAFSLRLCLENGLLDDARRQINDILLNQLYPDDLELNLTASFGGLKLDDFNLAKQFLYRQQQSMKNIMLAPPENAPELCLIWAKILNKLGRPWQPGFIFEQKIHLPASALEVLMLAEIRFTEYFENKAKQTELLEIADNTLAYSEALAYFHLGYLARLALAKNNDWRTQMDYGLLNLLCCRLQEGLFELAEASKKAIACGEEKAFARVLKAHDHNGAIARSL